MINRGGGGQQVHGKRQKPLALAKQKVLDRREITQIEGRVGSKAGRITFVVRGSSRRGVSARGAISDQKAACWKRKHIRGNGLLILSGE
jgi:hypothetical protein